MYSSNDLRVYDLLRDGARIFIKFHLVIQEMNVSECHATEELPQRQSTVELLHVFQLEISFIGREWIWFCLIPLWNYIVNYMCQQKGNLYAHE